MLGFYLNQCLFSLFGLYSFSFGDLVEAGTQYITYDGSISGYFEHPQSAPSNCPTYYFDSLENTTLRVGVNPPWDTNPFYFSIQHDGNWDNCFSGRCTYDPIYNLYFETASYLCLTDGGLSCVGLEDEGSFYFDPVENLNLNKATTAQFDGKEKGYRTIGNQSTFVANNDNIVNSFDFQRPQNYTEQEQCEESDLFEWNATTPFTYALNFTNTSAKALFSLRAPSGMIEFSFSGWRVDGGGEYYAPDPWNNGNYTPIALNTSNPSHPNFTFANGTEIAWKNYSNGWGAIGAISAAVPSVKIEDLETAMMWLLFMVVVGCLTFT